MQSLADTQTYKPISQKRIFDTAASCSRNSCSKIQKKQVCSK